VDPDQGPVQSFAHGLRDLRRQAGNPSYRTLAERTHYSRTVISDAARGERLPTLAVALAYVAACGGDADEWRARWHLAHQQIIESGAAGSVERAADASEAGPAASSLAAGGTSEAGADGGASRIRALRRRLLTAPVLVALGILVLTQVEAVAIWQVASASKPSTPVATPVADPVTVMDGADPGTSNCGPSATVLDSKPIILPRRAEIGGHAVPKGTVLGTVSLKYSSLCRGAWARFDPAGGVYGRNPNVAAVRLTVLRPADGTESSWRLPHVDEAYGDLLLTGVGCVIARGSVELVGLGITATAKTHCLPHH